uniref:Major core protein n=1 Tax=Thaumetopoea pityocampa cypovirus 5 TaxID=1591445 RepID=A0A0B4UCM0_9REOV|nr:major core protein [Thaumetopoea pityocampa cypovirus 5]
MMDVRNKRRDEDIDTFETRNNGKQIEKNEQKPRESTSERVERRETTRDGVRTTDESETGRTVKGKNERDKAIIDGDEEGKTIIIEGSKDNPDVKIVERLPDIRDMQEVSLFERKNKLLIKDIQDFNMGDNSVVTMPGPNYLMSHMDKFPANSTIRIELIDFEVSEDIWNYIGYESIQVQLAGGVRIKAQIEESIIRKTFETFQRGTRTVRYVLSDDLMKKSNATYHKGIPIVEESEDIFERNYFESVEAHSLTGKTISKGQYIIGAIKTLQSIMKDNRVIKNGEVMVITRDDERLRTPYNLMIGDTYTIEDANANIALVNLVDMRMKWLTAAMRELVLGPRRDESLYFYGREDEMMAAEINGKLYEDYALNNDMYVTEVLNKNFNELRENSRVQSKLKEQLLASSLKNTRYELPQLSSFISMPQMDMQHMTRVMMANLILDRSLPALFNEMNVRFLMESGALMLSQEFELRPRALLTDMNASSLNQAINSIVRRYELTSIYEMFAKEMGPSNSIYYLFNEHTRASYTGNDSILILIEVILFSQFFPRLTAEVKGEISMVILNFLFAQFPDEYNRFIANYGIRYRMVNGVAEFNLDDVRDWEQSEDQLSEWHPSVFYPNRLRGAYPVLNSIRDVMLPRGTLIRDTRAEAAEYPRESSAPYHYIPFQIGPRRMVNSLEAYATLFDATMKKIVEKMKKGMQTLRTATAVSLNTYITHVKTKLSQVSPLYVQHMAVVLEALANQAYNFMPNYNGDLGTWKQTQYCITDDGSTPMLLYSTGQAEDNQYNILRTDIVWSLIYGVDGPVLRNAGLGLDGIKQNIRLSAPDGESAMIRSRELMSTMDGQLRSLGLVLELQGEDKLVRVTEYELVNLDTVVRIISHGDYRNMLSSYEESAFIVNIETTVQQVEQALEDGIVLFVFDVDATPQIRDLLLTDPTVYVTTIYQTNNIREDIGTEDTVIGNYIRLMMVPLSDILLEMDENDYTRELSKFRVKMPDMRGPTMKKILSVLLKENKRTSEQRALAKYFLNYTRGINTKLNFKNPQIRRAGMDGMPIEFDINLDNPYFERSENFLSTKDRERLLVGMKMINNRYFEPLKGIRIVKAEMETITPDQTYYVPEDIRVVEYSDERELFNRLPRPGMTTALAFPDAEGNPTSIASRWERIRLIIPFRTPIPEYDMEGILNGIEYSGWIVDMPDREYVFSVSYADDEYVGENLKRYLEYDDDRILDITLLDTTTYRSGTTLDLPIVANRRRYVFPMEDPTWVFVAMNLMESGEAMPPDARIPNPEHYSTGTMDFNGTLRYNDGVQKLSRDEISMTNRMYKLSPNVVTKLDAKIAVRNPASLDDIIF